MLTCPLSVFLTSNELRRTPSLETVSFSTFFKQLLLCLLNFAFSYVHWHLSYAEAMFWAQDLSLLLNPTLNSCSITWIMFSVNSLFEYPWNNFSQFPAFHGMTTKLWYPGRYVSCISTCLKCQQLCCVLIRCWGRQSNWIEDGWVGGGRGGERREEIGKVEEVGEFKQNWTVSTVRPGIDI